MGFKSFIKSGYKSIKNGAKSVAHAIKGAAKFSADTFVAKPVGFLTSWVPVTKKLRIQVFVLRDETGISLLDATSTQQLQNALNYAITTFKQKFDIEIKAYGNPIIQTLPKAAPKAALDIACDGGAFKNEVGAAGRYFEKNIAGWNIIPVSLAFPISVFVVREITGKLGCSLGAATDYVTLSTVPVSATATLTGVSSLSTLVHELAHSCGLLHRSETNNIMYENDGRGNDVTYWQKNIVRSSRHVSFL